MQKPLCGHTLKSHQSCVPPLHLHWLLLVPSKARWPMWAASCSFHTASGAKLLRTARGKSCHRKRATATAGKTEKVHSFEESACRNWTEKGWRRERLSCRKPDMPCNTTVHLTLISLQQRHPRGVVSTESALPITSSKTHLYSTDLLTRGRGGW